MKLKSILNEIYFLFNKFRYSLHFTNIGKKLKIRGSIIIYGNSISLGNFVSINKGVILNSARSKIKIGNYVTLSTYTQLHCSGLDLSKHYSKRNHKSAEIILEDGVWLSSGVIVNPGIKIGEGSVVAPGSVVTKNIPPFELWGGVPAKKIKDISNN